MNILCIKLKAITQNYLQHHYLSSYLWGSIFTHTWKTLTSLHCFTKGEVWIHKICLTLPLLLKCLYKARRVRGHINIFVIRVSNFPVFLRFLIGLLEYRTFNVVFLVYHWISMTCLQSQWYYYESKVFWGQKIIKFH